MKIVKGQVYLGSYGEGWVEVVGLDDPYVAVKEPEGWAIKNVDEDYGVLVLEPYGSYYARKALLNL